MRRRAFSLVELLAVMAVIAVLASLLLGAIGPVRSAARRVVCSSNQRQLVMAMAGYAQDWSGMAPLVFEAVKQGSYLVTNINDADRAMGALYHGELIDDPRSLFCPSNGSDAYRFNTALNPWPHRPGQNTRSGYSVRPVSYTVGALAVGDRLPLLGGYAARAVLSDVCSDSSALDSSGHRDGFPVGYGDGHVGYVRREAMAPAWLATGALGAWSPAWNAAEDQLWSSFDAAM